MTFFSTKFALVFQNGFERLLHTHPSDRDRGTRFAEEARAERLSNLIRFGFAFTWLATAAVYLGSNQTDFNVINMTAGSSLMVISVLYHWWMARCGYRAAYKYILTTTDLMLSIGILVAYAVVAGPVFVLKMPIYLTVLCSVGLAALRIQRALAIYAGTLAVVMLVGFWAWMELWYGIDYGTRMEHAFGGKISGPYLFDTVNFFVAFAVFTVAAANNIRRQVELRVAEAEHAARESERATMAAGLAHEIRNPLSGIYGAAQIIQESDAAATRDHVRHAEMILTNARRLRGVLDGFLNFARPFSVRPRSVDLHGIVAAFCEEQSRPGSDGPVEFVSASAPLPVVTDPEAVLQILLNLVQNARRYRQAGSPVRIRVLERGKSVALCVEDDGPGVAEAIRKNLFDPFLTGSPGGTGLGLALSRKIARTLGGDLTYEPLDPGARFILDLNDPSRRTA